MSAHDKIVVRIDGAPQPIGPYSQAVKSGEFIFVSGQLGIDPASGQLVAGDAAPLVRTCAQRPGRPAASYHVAAVGAPPDQTRRSRSTPAAVVRRSRRAPISS